MIDIIAYGEARRARIGALMAKVEAGDPEAKAVLRADQERWWTSRYGHNVTHAAANEYIAIRGVWDASPYSLCGKTSSDDPADPHKASGGAMKLGPADASLVTCARCKKLLAKRALQPTKPNTKGNQVPKKTSKKQVVSVTSSGASFAGIISGGQSYSPAEIDEATAILDDMRTKRYFYKSGCGPVIVAAIIRDVRNGKTLEPQEDLDRAPKYPRGDSLGLGSSQGILDAGWEYVSAEIAEADFLCYKHVLSKDKDTVISVAVLVRRIRAAEFRLKHQIRLDLGKIEISPDGNSAFADSVIHIDGSSQMSTFPIRIGPSIVHHWKDTRGAQLARQFNVATSVLCAAVADVIRPFEQQVWESLPAETRAAQGG